MKHPIYESKEKQIIVLVREFDKPNNRGMIKNILRSVPEHEMGTVSDVFAKVEIFKEIIKNGHICIDKGPGEWYSEITMKTLSSIRISDFKMPFNAGAIKLSNTETMYFAKMTYEAIIANADKMGYRIDPNTVHELSEGAIYVLLGSQKIVLPYKLTVKETIDLIVDINKDKNDPVSSNKIYERVNEFLSIMLYTASFTNDSTRVKKSIAKGVKSAAKGIKKHTVNIIKLYQHISNSEINDNDHVGKSSDKKWVVRGHWRNQYYKSTDEHKPKWIDPYWKGSGNEEVNKVYELPKRTE